MTNKKIELKGIILMTLAAFGGLSLISCSNDDDYAAVDNQNPTISLTSDHIQTEAGRSFTIGGTVTDNDGLKSITLVCEGMYLNKEINLLDVHPDTLYYSYTLAYIYTADSGWDDSDSFPVIITVEDVLGNKTSTTCTVSADGDFTAPTFTAAPSSALTVIIQNPKLTVNATVSDNKVLDYITIKIPSLGVSDSVLTGNVSSYKLKKTLELPAVKGTYEMTLTVADTFGNTTTTTSTITVDEMPDFEKMYLADVDDAADLNSDIYGVPMLIDHTGEYTYSAKYYNQTAGTTVRFIPQTTDFEPICFGIDPDNTEQLINSPSDALGIELNEVGYYQIDFNIVTNEYTVSTYTPTTEAMTLDGTTTVNFNDGSGDQPAQICLAGSNLPDGTPSWTTNQNNGAYILYQSTTNPYLLYREGTYTAGDQVSFTISQTHWWGWWPEPYWRFDSSGLNEYNVLNGGDNMTAVTVPATDSYRFEFDYSLLRSRIILVK